MTVLSVAEARAFLPGSPLTDAALELAIADVEAEIVDRFGAYYPTPVVERFDSVGDWNGGIVLSRKPASITSIVESTAYAGSPVPTRTLAVSDWRLRGSILERLSSGTYPARGWSRYGVEVTYVPRDDTARRKMATVDVLKVETSFSGLASRRIGDYSETADSGATGDGVVAKRRKILRRLGKPLVLR